MKTKQAKSRFDGFSDADLEWNIKGMGEVIRTGKTLGGDELQQVAIDNIKLEQMAIVAELARRLLPESRTAKRGN